MKSIKKILNLIFLPALFVVLFIVGTTTINADTACGDGSECFGSGAYKRIDSCTTNFYNWCQNNTWTDHVPFSCPTGGGSGSCVGLAKGVNGCTGTATTTIDCTCSQQGYSCNSDGASCGVPDAYNNYGTCNCEPTTSEGCPEPSDGFRGCCISSVPTPTPTPPVGPYCGDGTCSTSIGESCSNCISDCGICPQETPPPGYPYCGDGSCNNGEDYCDCNVDGCPWKNCFPDDDEKSCEIVLSPKNTTVSTIDPPFYAEAIVSNVTNGTLNEVRFSSGTNSVAVNPTAVEGGSYPYTGVYKSLITPVTAGTSTISVAGVVDGVELCSDTGQVTIEDQPVTCGFDEPPDCTPDSLVVNGGLPITEGDDNVGFRIEMFDVGENVLCNGSFENGTSGWTASNDIGLFSSVYNANWSIYSLYFAALKRQDDSIPPIDPYLVSDWYDVGYNVTNHNFVLDWVGLSNGSGPVSQTVSGIAVQRYPNGAFDSYDTKWSAPVDFYNDRWTTFHKIFGTFQQSPDNNTSSRVRAVLRTPPTSQPGNVDYAVYYDNVKLYDIENTGVDEGTIKWYYKSTDDLLCDAGTWHELVGTQTDNWENGYARISGIDLNTAGPGGTPLEPGSYYLAVNANDIQGLKMSGNPGGCDSSYFDALRPNCSGYFTVGACDQCDPTCSSYVGAEPSRVTGLRINGQTTGGSTHNTTTTTSMSYSWNAVSLPSPSTNDYYQIRMWNRSASVPLINGVPTDSACAASPHCKTITRANSAGTTYSAFPDIVPDNKMAVAVRGRNTSSCGTVDGAWSVVNNHDLYANIGGDIINSSSASYDVLSGACTGPSSPQETLPASASLTSSNGSAVPDPIANQNDWRVVDLPFAPTSAWNDYRSNVTAITSVATDTPAYTCICPPATVSNPFECTYYDRVAGTGTSMSNNIYVSDIILPNGPWWQSSRGNVFAASTLSDSLKSDIPSQCLASSCSPFIVDENLAGNEKSAGIPISGANSMTAGTGSFTNRSNPDTHSLNANHNNLIKEGYDHFAGEIDFADVGKLITASAISSSNIGQLSGADQDPVDNTEVYYRSGDLTIDLTSKYTVNGSVKKIIFVSGDLTFENNGGDQQIIEVATGGYIAFIVGGNINIDPSVGSSTATSTTVDLEGVYVADGFINIQGYTNDALKDNKFIGEGTFVGWSGINLERDYKNTGNVLDAADNNENPIEVFTFRPAFNKDTPNIMKRPNLVWQEVN